MTLPSCYPPWQKPEQEPTGNTDCQGPADPQSLADRFAGCQRMCEHMPAQCAAMPEQRGRPENMEDMPHPAAMTSTSQAECVSQRIRGRLSSLASIAADPSS